MGRTENRKFYNEMCKIGKYNSDTYRAWMSKMYRTNSNGDLILDSNNKPIMKGSAVGLYFQFYMALIFAIFFVYENPIVVEKKGDGYNSVYGGLHMRWHHRKRDKKDDSGK
jgi:hypothetical protein